MKKNKKKIKKALKTIKCYQKLMGQQTKGQQYQEIEVDYNNDWHEKWFPFTYDNTMPEVSPLEYGLL